MNRKLFVCLFLLLVLNPAAPVFAGEIPGEIRMQVGSVNAVVDGNFVELPAAPEVFDGITMVPLRFLADTFRLQTEWNQENREVVISGEGTVLCLWPASERALVNGEEKKLSGAPVVEEGVTLVPLRFVAENMNCQVRFLAETKEIHIEKLPPPPPPNNPPEARFRVLKDEVAQGETVYYRDESSDPDGDEIVERRWTGKERAFFAPGEYEVTLRVKDSRGAWSEPFTRVIKVTEEVKMDRLTYNLRHPIPGEPVDISDIDVLGLRQIKPRLTPAGGSVMVSNSPETVRREGVLYSDILSGENRVYYHHINGLPRAIGIFLVASNNSGEPVRFTVERSGVAGPADPMSVGRASAYRYLDSTPAGPVVLQPGEKVVLNKGATNTIKPGQATHGIFDVNADGELTLSVVAATSMDRVDYVMNTFLIPGDGMHVRGTYPRCERQMVVDYSGSQPARVVVADGNDDRFLYGKDAEQWLKNKGNYGINYRIAIRSKNRVGVLFNPRGGTFAGAGSWDGEAFYIPNRGILQPQTQAALLGVLEPGEEKVFEFIPPAGSSLPVNLILIPF